MGVLRVTLELRRLDVENGEMWTKNRRTFEALTSGADFAGYTLDESVRTERDAIRAALNRIDSQWYRSAIADGDPDFKMATTRISALQSAVAMWPALFALDTNLDAARGKIDGQDQIPIQTNPGEPTFAKAAQELLNRAAIQVDELAGLSARISSAGSLAESWGSAYRTERHQLLPAVSGRTGVGT